jgi:hypothetical protein
LVAEQFRNRWSRRSDGLCWNVVISGTCGEEKLYLERVRAVDMTNTAIDSSCINQCLLCMSTSLAANCNRSYVCEVYQLTVWMNWGKSVTRAVEETHRQQVFVFWIEKSWLAQKDAFTLELQTAYRTYTELVSFSSVLGGEEQKFYQFFYLLF